jgi:hypothetical protein
MAITYSPLSQSEKEDALKMKKKGLSTKEIMSEIQSKREAGPSYFQKIAMGFSEGYQKEKDVWEEQKKLDPEGTSAKSAIKDVGRATIYAGVPNPGLFTDPSNYASHLFRSVMSPIAGAVGEAVDPLVKPIADTAISAGKSVFSALPEGVQGAAKDKVSEAYSWYEGLTPEQKNRLKITVGNVEAALAVGDIAGLNAIAKGSAKKIGKTAMGDVAQMMNQRLKTLSFENVLKKGVETAQGIPTMTNNAIKAIGGKVGDMTGGKIQAFKKEAVEIGKDMVAQTYKLDRDTIRTVIDDPDFFKKFRDGTISKKDVVDDLYNTIAKRIEAIDDVGEMYAPIRARGGVFGTPIKEVDNFLKRNGLRLENGKINKINPRSSRLTQADIKNVNDALEPMIQGNGFATSSTIDQWLNVRKIMDKHAGWNDAVSPDGKDFVKNLRGIINEKAHLDFEDLKKLDNSFSA